MQTRKRWWAIPLTLLTYAVALLLPFLYLASGAWLLFAIMELVGITFTTYIIRKARRRRLATRSALTPECQSHPSGRHREH